MGDSVPLSRGTTSVSPRVASVFAAPSCALWLRDLQTHTTALQLRHAPATRSESASDSRRSSTSSGDSDSSNISISNCSSNSSRIRAALAQPSSLSNDALAYLLARHSSSRSRVATASNCSDSRSALNSCSAPLPAPPRRTTASFCAHGHDHFGDDDDDDDDDHLPYEKAMLAGASAGVAEHVVMYPVDTVKTRLQTAQLPGNPHYASVADAARRIIREEGALRLYRGIPATVAAAVPSHAIHFATYEHVRRRLGGDKPGHHPLENGLAGAVATCAHDAVVTPWDVVKQRLQVFNSRYTGVLDCVARTARHEGLRAFYASYPTTVLMNVPFQIVHFAGYESFKQLITADGRVRGPREEIVAGGMAGAAAGFVSTPFDLLKTRIQTFVADETATAAASTAPGGASAASSSSSSSNSSSGMRTARPSALQIARMIHNAEGVRGFWRGATARVVYFIPSAAICWSTYEATKRALKDAW